MTTTMPARMLRLLSLLQGRREWSGAELAERLGVTDRTVRRDIDRLRELGYPVDGTTGTSGGYRLVSGRDLPPLLLDDDEAVAVVVGLRTAAGSVAGIEETSVRAMAKLEQVLPARLRQQVAALTDSTSSVVSWPLGPQVDAGTLAVLATACRDHELVTFDHLGRDGSTTARRVEPHGLVTMHNHWYLVAYDTARADWRTFRLDRLAAPTPTRLRFTPRELPAADAAQYLAATIRAAPYRHTAMVLVRAAAGEVLAGLRGPLPGAVTPVDADTCSVGLGSDSLDLVAQSVARLAALGFGLTVEASEEVLDRLRSAGRRLADL
ncbi:transcriptional regulator [Solihabitans fulvus]|uniref:Transcriptional regulator n=1 Tax=Solihabitans fulvus TaxID=1892852 RepID=A0A5B2WZP6_9PSEU|nr:transcriptional regulator [Solihabitans fulvus]KAA2255939.1 transcriptional regulator [Solihabitans fulvus]